MEPTFDPKVLKGLAILGREDVVDGAAYREFVVLSFAILTRQQGASEELLHTSPKFEQIDRIMLKQAYSAFATFLLEAVKTNITTEQTTQILEEATFSAERIQLFDQLYAMQKARLRDTVAQTGFDLPNLVDVNWRLGYEVRSSSVGKVNDPVYLLKMTTRNDKGDLEEVEVSLDQHQLLDMRRKVQDATTQVQRVLKATDQWQ